MGQAVQDQVVAAALLQIVGLQGDALRREDHASSVDLDVQIEASKDLLVGRGPAQVRSQ